MSNIENESTMQEVEKSSMSTKEVQNDTPEPTCDLKKQNDTSNIVEEKDSELEKLKNENANLKTKLKNVLHDLQARTEERENYKNKATDLETEVNNLKNQQPSTNNLTPAQQQAVHNLKKQSEEMLTRAKGVIFDKTKLIKHQELQVETLTLQVASLKEVLDITKELLNIRNLEVKELEEKMDILEQKISVEKIKHDLMNSKMESVTKMNVDLKQEYELQLQLFNELREQYERREELRHFQEENKN